MAYIDVTAHPLADLVSLQGRTAVVTGGATGIGRAIAGRLAEAGATVVIGDLDEASASETADDLGQFGGVHYAARLDVRDHSSITQLADFAISATGRIDIWVNNAGIYPSSPALAIEDADWARVLDVNLTGSFYGAREAALRMKPNQGVIVNILSTAAFNTSNGNSPAHYVASKHGVLGLIKSLAVELGRNGIRVVGVAPTLTETPGVDAKRALSQEIRQGLAAYGASLPLGRLGMPDDIARVVLFAALDLSTFVNGCVIPVDGGDLAR